MCEFVKQRSGGGCRRERRTSLPRVCRSTQSILTCVHLLDVHSTAFVVDDRILGVHPANASRVMRIANDNVRIVDVVYDLGCGRAECELGDMMFVGDTDAFQRE